MSRNSLGITILTFCLCLTQMAKAQYDHETVRLCMKSVDINRCIKGYGNNNNRSRSKRRNSQTNIEGPIELEVIPYRGKGN